MILEKTVNYLEQNLFDNIDYDELARHLYTNKYNIMRIFSASTDYTLAEYVRLRRLSEAGKIISETNTPIISIAFDCGYSTAESFSKAYKKFHGLSPTSTRKTKRFKYVPAWNAAIKYNKGEQSMQFEIVNFTNETFVGYGERFTGKAENRGKQDEKFVLSTRRRQDALRILRSDGDCDWWEILDDFDDDGFTLFYSVKPNFADLCNLSDNDYEVLARKTVEEKYDNVFTADELKTEIRSFDTITINGKYAKFVSKYKEFPMDLLDDFTKSVYAGIDDYGFTRDETRPELLRVHWCKRERIKERHLELYLPIK